MASQRGLGKGLDLLIPNNVGDQKNKKVDVLDKKQETLVKITKVEPNREQ